MATAGSVLAARVYEACTSGVVADAAGVAPLTWASASAPRVFRGLGGYLAGRNRGRLPFLEFDIQEQAYEPTTATGGDLTQRVLLRAHCGGSNLEAAGDRLEAILAAALASIRDESSDNLTAIGGDTISPMQAGPWGHQREAMMTVVQSFARNDYEVQ